MSTMTTVLDITSEETRELDALALIAKVQHAKAKIEELSAIEKAARDELAVLLDFGSHQIGSHTVTINAPLKYSTEGKTRFMELFPASERPEFYELALNTRAVDAILKEDAKAFKHATSIVTTIRG